MGFRRAIAVMCVGFFFSVFFTWYTVRPLSDLLWYFSAGGRVLLGDFWAVHDVFAATVSDAAAYDGGGFFLQHRADCRGDRDGGFGVLANQALGGFCVIRCCMPGFCSCLRWGRRCCCRI